MRRPLIRALGVGEWWPPLWQGLLCALLFLIAFSVRSLHAVDLAPVMEGHAQPGVRMANRYDAAAEAILSGTALFLPEQKDPHDTGILARPPGYPLVLAAVYRSIGRGYFAVGTFQDLLDSLSVVVLFALASTLVSMRVGLVASLLLALGHYSAYYANIVTPDTLCTLPVLVAFLVLARARPRGFPPLPAVALAGALVGLSAWLRPNAVVLGVFWAVVLLFLHGLSRPHLVRAGLLAFTSLLVLAPITLRNYLLFGRFVPVSINMGIVLWEGIADGGGESFGAKGRDFEVAWQESQEFQNARYAEWWASPDGIDRDRARVRKSLAVIKAHPGFFAKATLSRFLTMVSYRYDEPPVLQASAPDGLGPPHPGVAGLAVSFGERIGFLRAIVRPLQEALGALLVPFVAVGVLVLSVLGPKRALTLGVVPLSVLLLQSPLHLEFRVTLPMHVFLLVFAATGLVVVPGLARLALEVTGDERSKVVAEDKGPEPHEGRPQA
jgi:hypothetical protein